MPGSAKNFSDWMLGYTGIRLNLMIYSLPRWEIFYVLANGALNANTVWMQWSAGRGLWPLLPEIVRTDLTNARSSLDRLVEFSFWGLLFLFWAFWTPWALVIGLLWMIISYGMTLQAAMAYGDLLEAAFDLHRLSLYEAMGWSRPTDSEKEKAQGKQMTEFLWRGTMPEQITYQSKEG